MKAREIGRVTLLALLIVALLAARPTATLITDLWWFQSVQYAGVFWTTLWARLLLGGVTFFAFLAATGATCGWILRHRSRLTMKNAQVLEFRRPAHLPPAVPLVLGVFLCVISLMAAMEASTHGDLLLSAWYGRHFNQADPLFGLDVGFYVFRLPLLLWLYDRLFFLIFVCALLAFGLHFAVRSIQVVPDQFVISPAARAQLMDLAGLALLLKGLGYLLDTFGLLVEQQPDGQAILTGARFTDVHVLLPMLYVSMVLCIASAVVVWSNRNPKGWPRTLATLSVLVVVTFVGNVVLPVLAQRFIVQPNQEERERPYIVQHIKFTRQAYNLDAVQASLFSGEGRLTPELMAQNETTIQNIPLWDHKNLKATLKQLQAIRSYYDFRSVDNDRYTVDGQYRQVMLAPRELSEETLPTKGWINEHLSYTHGYGLCMAVVNKVDEEGKPDLLVQNIPPQGPSSLHIDRPQIYYGEAARALSQNDYVFVDTTTQEFDYPTDSNANGGSAFTHYAGKGGVLLTGAWQRWLYFLRFGESNIILNTSVQDGSRIMYYRNIQERVAQVTPWVTYDPDPYMVISGGQLYWILDGYTTSSTYPYSAFDTRFVDNAAIQCNYVRNSVKAVVNAYDGTMQFYLADAQDPIVQTYSDIFPGVFQPLSSMPSDLRAHLRYPQQYFEIQAAVFTTFHMEDPANFYRRQDQWQVAQEGPNAVSEPYYTILKLRDQQKEEFVLMLPFSPANKQNMVAWMAARCDGPNYGKLVAYEFPRQKNIYGPAQIVAQLNQNAEISKSLTLWNQKGSSIPPGTLLVIPVGDALLYVQPVYLSANGTGMPELVAVIVSDGTRLAMGSTLQAALAQVVEQAPGKAAVTPTLPHAGGMEWKALVDDANNHMNAAEAAQRNGDWAKYGEELKQLKADLEEMSHRQEPQQEPGPTATPQ